ncbi:MFS transporter [soil metagenome]
MGLLSFAAVYANVVMTPVLAQIGREFGTSTGTAGLVVAAYGVPGVLSALVVGPYSDRFGRKPFLLAGTILMGACTVIAALVPSFELLLVSRALAGMGASVLFPNINAAIGDSFPYLERGRAISTVIGLNTFASIGGIPLAGIVAEATTWRVSVAMVGLVALLAALALAVLMPSDRPHGEQEAARELYARIVRSRSALGAIASSLMGALFWFTWVTYVVVYFEHGHSLSQGLASTAALTLGVGVLIGSQIGGRLGDRVGHRRVVAWSIALSSLVLVALTNIPLPLLAAAALNLVLSAVIGARFATNTAMLTEQVPEARGTMLAMSSSVVSLGIVAGAVVGGLIIDGPGFPALGLVCGAVGLLSAAIVVIFVTEETLDLENEPAFR